MKGAAASAALSLAFARLNTASRCSPRLSAERACHRAAPRAPKGSRGGYPDDARATAHADEAFASPSCAVGRWAWSEGLACGERPSSFVTHRTPGSPRRRAERTGGPPRLLGHAAVDPLPSPPREGRRLPKDRGAFCYSGTLPVGRSPAGHMSVTRDCSRRVRPGSALRHAAPHVSVIVWGIAPKGRAFVSVSFGASS